MDNLTKTFTIKPRDYIRAGEVSIAIRGLLKNIGFAMDLIGRVSVCSYESEMNVVMHGGNGTAKLTIGTTEVVLEVGDDGVGIENVELAFKEGYSTATEEAQEMGFGAGMGLPNIKKCADSLEIRPEKGKCTYLKMSFSARSENG
ncbi:MAG: ATP-binding protein [Desulfobacterales bacterium]|nr:ATP-binding protein [Desulfobacterales bacterium]